MATLGQAQDAIAGDLRGNLQAPRRWLLELHEGGKTWREIAAYFGEKRHQELWRFAMLGRPPRRHRLRVLLGLVRPRKPRLCPKCGAEVN